MFSIKIKISFSWYCFWNVKLKYFVCLLVVDIKMYQYICTLRHTYMYTVHELCKKKNQELWKDEVDFRRIFIKYIISQRNGRTFQKGGPSSRRRDPAQRFNQWLVQGSKSLMSFIWKSRCNFSQCCHNYSKFGYYDI